MRGGWLRGLAAAVPSRCAVCESWPAEPVCSDCRVRFAPPRQRCVRCALPVPSGVSECGACVRKPPPLDACFVAVDYAYPWAALITHYKFHGEPGWAGTFARLLGQVPGVPAALARADLVLPMPLAPERLRSRGFNQALEIALRLAPGRVRADLLLRLRETPPQSALSLAERVANVRGAFGPDPLKAAALYGRHVVLVDDVMTSGASLCAAAQALRASGVCSVVALAMARTEAPE